MWKLKVLSYDNHSLQEEVRDPADHSSAAPHSLTQSSSSSSLPQLHELEAHCTTSVHDTRFEQAVIHVWRMVFSLLVERDNRSTTEVRGRGGGGEERGGEGDNRSAAEVRARGGEGEGRGGERDNRSAAEVRARGGERDNRSAAEVRWRGGEEKGGEGRGEGQQEHC